MENTFSTPVRNQTLTKGSHQLSNELSRPSHVYIHAATSDNTRKAYQSDIRHFFAWGGVLPATIDQIILYLEQHAATLNSRTLLRRLTALKIWHVSQDFPDPTTHPLVRKTIKGIQNIHGRAKVKATALTLTTLTQMCNHLMKSERLIDLRNNALLQIGFFGAFRRSELVAIQYEHLRFVPEGVEIFIPSSKTDQTQEGHICAIPYGNKNNLCPVKALSTWCENAGITTGPIFRQLNKSQYVSEKSVNSHHIGIIIKSLAIACKLPEAQHYSGHSLRRGFATTAAQKGASLVSIMRHGRWRHQSTVIGYIEEGQRFEENIAGMILENVSYD